MAVPSRMVSWLSVTYLRRRVDLSQDSCVVWYSKHYCLPLSVKRFVYTCRRKNACTESAPAALKIWRQDAAANCPGTSWSTLDVDGAYSGILS